MYMYKYFLFFDMKHYRRFHPYKNDSNYHYDKRKQQLTSFNKNHNHIQPTRREGCIGAGIIAFTIREDNNNNDNEKIEEIYMIRNNKNHTLFLPFEYRNHNNEGDDLIATTVRIFNKYTHHVFERNVDDPLYHEIHKKNKEHKGRSPKCWFSQR